MIFLIFSLTTAECPKEYPYAYDGEIYIEYNKTNSIGYRNRCANIVTWDPENPKSPLEITMPFDRQLDAWSEAWMETNMDMISVKCPHFPTPCTDAAGIVMTVFGLSVKTG